MKFLISALVILTLSPSTLLAASADEVHAQIESYLGFKSFEESFQNGNRLEFNFKEVLRGISNEATRNYQMKVEPDMALIQAKEADGSIGTAEEIPKRQWEIWNGNYSRTITDLLDFYGYTLDMKIVGPVDIQVVVNGQLDNLSGLKVEYTGSNSYGVKVSGQYIVTNQLPGMAQVVYRHEEVSGIKRTWTLLQFSHQ